MPLFRIYRPYGANHILVGEVEAADRPAARELGWALAGGNRRIEAFLPHENPDDDVADAMGGLDECGPGVAPGVFAALSTLAAMGRKAERPALMPDAYRAACDAVAAGVGALQACDNRDVVALRRALQAAVDRLSAARLARRDSALSARSAELLRHSSIVLADAYERRGRVACDPLPRNGWLTDPITDAAASAFDEAPATGEPASKRAA